MIVLKKIKILVFIVFLFNQSNLAQFDTESDVVEFKIFKSYDRIHQNKELKIAVMAVINNMWHINSNEPSEDYMVGTSVEISAGEKFQLKKLKFPEPLELIFSFSITPISVYEGEVYISGVIPIPADIELGEYKIPIHITYQACNDASCLSPRSIKEEISIIVVEKEIQIQEINKEIFEKLNL